MHPLCRPRRRPNRPYRTFHGAAHRNIFWKTLPAYRQGRFQRFTMAPFQLRAAVNAAPYMYTPSRHHTHTSPHQFASRTFLSRHSRLKPTYQRRQKVLQPLTNVINNVGDTITNTPFKNSDLQTSLRTSVADYDLILFLGIRRNAGKFRHQAYHKVHLWVPHRPRLLPVLNRRQVFVMTPLLLQKYSQPAYKNSDHGKRAAPISGGVLGPPYWSP